MTIFSLDGYEVLAIGTIVFSSLFVVVCVIRAWFNMRKRRKDKARSDRSGARYLGVVRQEETTREWEEIKRGLAIMEERNFLRAYQKAITTEPSITKEEVKMPEYRRIRCE